MTKKSMWHWDLEWWTRLVDQHVQTRQTTLSNTISIQQFRIISSWWTLVHWKGQVDHTWWREKCSQHVGTARLVWPYISGQSIFSFVNIICRKVSRWELVRKSVEGKLYIDWLDVLVPWWRNCREFHKWEIVRSEVGFCRNILCWKF